MNNVQNNRKSASDDIGFITAKLRSFGYSKCTDDDFFTDDSNRTVKEMQLVTVYDRGNVMNINFLQTFGQSFKIKKFSMINNKSQVSVRVWTTNDTKKAKK